MITGFNTDVDYNNKTYHVQTEDKGMDNPYIESLVYRGGGIIFSKRTSYASKLAAGISEKEIRALLENQHKTIIAAIRKGKFEEGVPPPVAPVTLEGAPKAASPPTAPPASPSAAAKPAGAKVTAAPPPPTPTPPASVQEAPTKASLDEMIQAYLIQEKEKDQLEIRVPQGIEFFSGSIVPFQVKAETSVSKKPIPGAEVVAKLITTFSPPQDLFTGYTNAEGLLTMTLKIPPFKHGNAAVIIMGKSKEYGNTEYKQLVKKKN
jgi:acetyl-CoA acetyltransferase